jgi:4-diphosphocytidyl-2-C-methyl-D-erythritol kinase
MTFPILKNEIKKMSPAKINLTLEILGKREDGYHEIRSIMQRIGLYDVISIRPSLGKGEFTCPGHPELENKENLALKALHLLEKELGRRLPLSIELKKRIPGGGGLGGGSSNAATILSAVNQFTGNQVPKKRLLALASQIGSDVPFFLFRKTALAGGRGEVLDPWLNFPKWWFVLIYPGFPVSTSWAYNQLKIPLTIKKKLPNINHLKQRGVIPPFHRLENDLEEVVLPAFPVLKNIKKALRKEGCQKALMSGSGSVIFGIWENGLRAKEAYRRLKKQGWGQVFLTHGL